MIFNSYQFILLFLPATLLIFALCCRYTPKLSTASLLAASLFFYGYWSIFHLLWLILSILVNYTISLLIVRYRHTSTALMTTAVAFNLGLLGYFKYYAFIYNNTLALFSPTNPISIILPIGISFFTFQQIAYVVDVAKEKTQPNNLLTYSLFVMFFPQLIAGPIVHNAEMIPQFEKKKKSIIPEIQLGICFFIIGLVKKVFIADKISPTVAKAFAMAGTQTFDFYESWRGAIAYTLQIYFDFSGYSDMAIGLALLFGIYIPINFNAPYRSSSIIMFWRRWHITLSRFLRDYLYFPLGGGRVTYSKKLRNVFIVMFIGGIWHGAGWTFILWGLMHAVAIMINHIWKEKTSFSMSQITGWALTALFVILAWVPFRAPSIETAIAFYKSMLGLNGSYASAKILANMDIITGIQSLDIFLNRLFYGSTPFLPYFLVGIVLIFFAPTTQQLLKYPYNEPEEQTLGYNIRTSLNSMFQWRPSSVYSGILAGLILGVTFLHLGSLSEFIYFQF